MLRLRLRLRLRYCASGRNEPDDQWEGGRDGKNSRGRRERGEMGNDGSIDGGWREREGGRQGGMERDRVREIEGSFKLLIILFSLLLVLLVAAAIRRQGNGVKREFGKKECPRSLKRQFGAAFVTDAAYAWQRGRGGAAGRSLIRPAVQHFGKGCAQVSLSKARLGVPNI